MNGLELAKKYYETAGASALQEAFPELFPRMAVGLAGEGSECFGFDDEISRDHDWGAAFCIWLDRDDYEKYGAAVQQVYNSLPAEIDGYPRRVSSSTAQGRDGVLCIQDWYRKYTGCPEGPQTLAEWRRVPEAFLATAVNGEIFHDPSGKFTAIREHLQSYYPEDVRIKKIAARAAAMAQAGQYNFGRCVQRGEYLAAELAKVEFLKAALSMVHLLNKKYAPFYKWMARSAKQMEKLPRAASMLEQLSLLQPAGEDGAAAVNLIERICALVTGELKRQGLLIRHDSAQVTPEGDLRLTLGAFGQSGAGEASGTGMPAGSEARPGNGAETSGTGEPEYSSFLLDLCPLIMQQIEDPYLRNSSFMQE
ncbi:MAG: DUF4037 domain-containing protein [Eubacterium sp.]|nr:DUF4037 domain-containing protein [Eubacterium sp.]